MPVRLEGTPVIVQPTLPDHPKFLRLKRRLGPGAEVMECLTRLWGHCQEDTRGEFWPGVDGEYVEVVCRWSGEEGKLFEALRAEWNGKPGWIVVEENGIRVCGWEEHNGSLLRSWRGGRMGGRKPRANPQVTPSQPQENLKGERSEKRREEKSTEGARARESANAGEGEVGRVGQVGPGAQSTPTLQEVLTWAGMDGIPEAVARAYWHARDEVGWQVKGETVRNARSGLKKYAETWRANEQRRLMENQGRGTKPEIDVTGLKARLASEGDPVKRKELRRQLEALG